MISILTQLKAILAGLAILISGMAGIAPAKYGAVYNPPAATALSSSTISTSGGMIKINNLSDVSSTSTALTNLFGSTALSVSQGGTGKTTPINRNFQFILESPTSTENIALFTFNATSTLSKIVAVNKSLNDTVTFGIGYSSNRQTATSSLNNLFASAQTVTATTTPVILTINASSTPNTNDTLIFYTTAASTTQLTLTGYYSEN